MMKKKIMILLSIIFLGIIFYYFFGVVSSSIGWYGYGKWKYRVGTTSILESKKRNVFVKELNYKIIDSSNLKNFYFKPYIEKGFKYGFNSSKETRIINSSTYPYNISYERNLNDSIAIYYKKGDEKKLDSLNGVWGYLKQPYIKDTLTLELNGANDIKGKPKKGIIKIW